MTDIPLHAKPAARFKRRIITIPLYVFIFHVLWICAPILFLLTICMDLCSGAQKLPRARVVLFVMIYFALNLAAMTALLCTWAFYGAWWRADKSRFIDTDAWIQRMWTSTAFNLAKRLFEVTLIVDGQDVAAKGPLLLFLRHTSLTDTLLGAIYVANPNKILLRYALKDELLWDPGIDIIAHRLPNAFLRRGGDKDADIKEIKNLAEGLGPQDGVIMYPEGTRFTTKKREKAIKRLQESNSLPAEIIIMAKQMKHVLPPRFGGPLALLAATQNTDVVFCAHTGLENTNSFSHLWRGGLMGTTVRVHFWRIPAEEIPKEAAEQIRWLCGEWLKVDSWVAKHKS
jgi:1-acyl-sn-glycerol-3-phosphate acyltransferase